MKPIVIISCLVFAALLGGCLSTSEAAAGDFGPQPTGIEAKSKAWFDANLKDPESARLQFGELSRIAVKEGLARGGAVRRGWLQVVYCNAKNSYGGYTGAHRYNFFFENDQLAGEVSPFINAGSAVILPPP